MGRLEGKVAIITGAGGGIGGAAARLFAREGAKVGLIELKEEAGRKVADDIAGAGGEALLLPADVSKPESLQPAIDRVAAKWGRLDVMYNNAGITNPPKPGQQGLRRLVDVDQAEIDKLYAVNVQGVINGCNAAVRQFEKQDGPKGVIVNTASVAGLIGYGSVLYGSTKGAVTTLTRALALELAPSGIRVNSVCPAGMPTNFMPGVAQSEAARQSMAASHPLGRPIEPEECANGALFLASDLASNITGVNLPVDGGLSAGTPLQRR
jgi:NAD(P)-dependent dehydrogenase (short-subunit alcohol dehydrogenase family)